MNTREKGGVMFHKKKGPDEPFAHSDDCKILAADPDVQIAWSEIGVESGRHAVSAGSSITTIPSPIAVSGSVRSIRRPAATRRCASSPPRPTRPCSGRC